MWFKNLQLYRLPSDWNMTLPRLQETLARFAFRPAAKTEFFARGWIPPRGEGEVVCSLERHWLVALGVEEKLLPASVINLAAKERIAKLEQQLGYRPGRKQAKEIKENVTGELLPRAFSRYRSTAGSSWTARTRRRPTRSSRCCAGHWTIFRRCRCGRTSLLSKR